MSDPEPLADDDDEESDRAAGPRKPGPDQNWSCDLLDLERTWLPTSPIKTERRHASVSLPLTEADQVRTFSQQNRDLQVLEHPDKS